MVVLTIHHEVAEAEDTLIGRVVIPSLEPGAEVDEWYPLLNSDGTPQVGGMSDKPSQMHVQLKFEMEGSVNRAQEEDALHAQEQERVRLEQEVQERLRHEQEAQEQERVRQEQERFRQVQEEQQRQAEEERRRVLAAQEQEAEHARQEQALEEAKRQRQELTRAAEEAQHRREVEAEELRRVHEEEANRQREFTHQLAIQAEADKRMQAQAQERLDQDSKDSANAAAHATAPNSVNMQLKLGLDFSAAGQQGSPARAAFEQNLIRDLSNATGLNPVSFRIKNMSPGSVVVDADIHADPSGRGPEPQQVAAELERQARDAYSLLRNGNLTCYTESLSFPSLKPGANIMAPPSLLEAPPSAQHPPQPSMHQAKLFVSVLQARNLPQTDRNGGCHAFCHSSAATCCG